MDSNEAAVGNLPVARPVLSQPAALAIFSIMGASDHASLVNNYLLKIVDKIGAKFFNEFVLRSFCPKQNGSSSKAGTARVSDVQQ